MPANPRYELVQQLEDMSVLAAWNGNTEEDLVLTFPSARVFRLRLVVEIREEFPDGSSVGSGF